MTNIASARLAGGIPPAQIAIRARCVHPHGEWMPSDAGDGRSIPEVFEAQAARTPERIAVVSPSRVLSYRRLNEEANQLAQRILAQSLPADVPIGVACGPGAAQVVASLAALEAGRFIASLDLSGPPDRCRQAIDYLGVSAIVVDGAADASRARSLARNLPIFDAGAPLPAAAARIDRLPRASPDALARIAVTSGSTGEPKGIRQTHRTVLAGVAARNDAIHLCAEDRMLVVTAAFTELWRPLVIGAALYLFDLKRDDLGRLRRWLQEGCISVLRSTPSVFRRLASALSSDSDASAPTAPALGSLRAVELMGEPVPSECVDVYRRHCAVDCVMINFLGSKEVLDYRAFYLDHSTAFDARAVPAGYPFGGAEIRLIDPRGEPIPPGTCGEIAVMTPSMSPGYWRLPESSRARFPRASAEDGGGRMFLTGDLGYQLPDGCLIHAGRVDSMVKIRGQRVDAQHVEHELRSLAEVDDAAVVVTTAAGEASLSAFFVARADSRPAATREPWRRLAARLPSHMMPAAWFRLDAIPTTAMGKVDRERLRYLAMDGARELMAGDDTPLEDASNGVAPPEIDPVELRESSPEREIAAMWAKVLRRPRVGWDDNVFELGGDSLMAMQVVARIQQRFAIDLPLGAMLDHPTVMGLAQYVRACQHSAQSGRSAVTRPIRARSRR